MIKLLAIRPRDPYSINTVTKELMMKPRSEKILDLGLCIVIGVGFAVLIYLGLPPY